MRILIPLTVFLAACSGSSSPTAQARTDPGTASAGLVVVELFQSQGC